MHPSNFNVILRRLRDSATANRKALAARPALANDRASRLFSALTRVAVGYAGWESDPITAGFDTGCGGLAWKLARRRAAEVLRSFGVTPAEADALWFRRARSSSRAGRLYGWIRALIDTGTYDADGGIADADTDGLDS